MKNIKAIAVKEFLHIFRDTRTLRLIILMPVLQMALYGYAVNTDVKHMATAVYDEDQTYLSRRLIDAFENSTYFHVISKVHSSKELYNELDRGKIKAGILIAPDFTKDILARRQGKLQLLIDGTDSNPASVALNTSQAIVTSFLQKEGLLGIQKMPIDFRPRLWYNPDLKSTFFLIPGLIGLLLQMLIPMITATAIVRERERGNIEQLLVTPIKPFELMVGKLIPYVCIGFLIAILIILSSRFLFEIPIRGSVFTLLWTTLLFLMVCLGVGLLASTIADNQQQASQLVMVLAVPSILLSGFIFPRETMPPFIYGLSYFIPLTYFIQIVRGIILKGLGVFELWDQILPLLGMVVVILWLSVLRFQKRLN